MISTEKKTKIVADLQTSNTDTGSPQVQAGILTERIKELTEHLKTNKHDFMARRGLLQAVGKRKRLLKYLAEQDAPAYLKLIEKLGLRPSRTRLTRTSAGLITLQVYDAVRLTIQGRDCMSDVSELPDHFPVLIGWITLHTLDFVVDPNAHTLVGNPAHGGEHIIELY